MSYRIVIAEDNKHMRAALVTKVEEAGHTVVARCRNGRELVETCQTLVPAPDLVIADLRMPEMEGHEAAQEISKSRQIPVIMTSVHAETSYIEACRNVPGIMGFYLKDALFVDTQLAIAIKFAVTHFKNIEGHEQDKIELEKALEARKLIERAKGILMERSRSKGEALSESEAFGRMQKRSTDTNTKIADIAKQIIEADKTLKESLE